MPTVFVPCFLNEVQSRRHKERRFSASKTPYCGACMLFLSFSHSVCVCERKKERKNNFASGRCLTRESMHMASFASQGIRSMRKINSCKSGKSLECRVLELQARAVVRNRSCLKKINTKKIPTKNGEVRRQKKSRNGPPFFFLSLLLPSPILPAEKSCMGEPIYIAMFGVPNDKLSTALDIFLFAKMKSGAAAPGPGAYVLTSEGKFRRIICSEARMTLGTERTTATPSSPLKKRRG